MPKIKPFRALYYNQEKNKDLSRVVCPPYDVISSEERERLYNKSPYNYIHISLGKEYEEDNSKHNKFIRAKNLLHDWLDKGILLQDESPCIYFYHQAYEVSGTKYNRLGFISLLQLSNEKKSSVYPHENTHAKTVDDRLKLWSTVKANLSCIFICFDDPQKTVRSIFKTKLSRQQPCMEVEDQNKVRHRIWRLYDPESIRQINDVVSGQHLFIADGHHRYQVANEYRKLEKEKLKKITGEEPFNYVMTYFTTIETKNLQIFPMHRMVKHFPQDHAFLEEYFQIEKIKNKRNIGEDLAKTVSKGHAYGLYTRDGIKLLKLKERFPIDKYIKEGSLEYRRLDATILKCLVFDRLGIKSEDILYTKDLEETIAKVDKREIDASFILNPVKISQLKAIALNEERMPPKTTYFYPKVLSGLTVYKLG